MTVGKVNSSFTQKKSKQSFEPTCYAGKNVFCSLAVATGKFSAPVWTMVQIGEIGRKSKATGN